MPDGRNPPPEENDGYYYDHSIGPTWPGNDGVNILNTLLGSPAFVKEYYGNKLKEHKLLLSFIVDVSKMGFSREAHKMLTRSTAPRLSHILKSFPKPPLQMSECSQPTRPIYPHDLTA
jgi:hypothetical protein